MKKTVLFILLALILATLTFVGCSQANSESRNDPPDQPTLSTLLAEAGLKKVEIYFRYDDVVPDSQKAAMAQWITNTVAAASLHMTGGDYEDPEDLVEEVVEQAEEIFSIEVRVFYLQYVIEGSSGNNWCTGKYADLTPSQKRVADFLNR